MTTAVSRRRRPRGIYRKGADLQQSPGDKGSTLPEYLEKAEVDALIAAAPNPQAKLLILEQWRAGLRISEALGLQTSDLRLDTDLPTLRVRSASAKGGKERIVPVHPELQAALIAATTYGNVDKGRLIDVSRTTAWRWVQQAAERAMDAGQIDPGRHVATHTLRHSYARHLLLSGIPLNYLQRWLGHANIKTTLIYLELVPDPAGSLASVP